MKKNKTVDEFIENEKHWKDELTVLREIFKQTEMEETIKWGSPVYTVGGKNVAGIGSFKNHFAIWFFQGFSQK